MALFVRYVVLLFTLIFFVTSLVGTLPLALFSFDFNGFLGQNGKLQVSIWSLVAQPTSVNETDYDGAQQSTQTPKDFEVVRANYLNCTDARTVYRVAQGSSIATTTFGFFAFLTAMVLVTCRRKMKLSLFIYTLLALICSALLLTADSLLYTKSYCTDNNRVEQKSFKESDYKPSVTFFLHCVSAGGWFVTLIIIPFAQGKWCDRW